jgi:DNA invertase Pin-like site-specific DNA recombinase
MGRGFISSGRGVDGAIAVGYIRVSTDVERQALGAQAQRAAIEQWAATHGVTVAQWCVEQVSGGAPLDRRPVLLQAIAMVATLKAGALVVQKLDRFSRCPVTAALAECELRKHGASLVCADGTGGGDDPTSELIRGILLTVARFEKALIRSRIRAALAVKRSRGERVGAPPYGFRAEGKSLVPHAEESATKERLRELRAAGMTIRAVRQQATAEGLRNRLGHPFTVAAVHAMVRESSSMPSQS